MDSVTCTACGTLNEIDNIYCWKCGYNLTNNTTLNSQNWNSHTKTFKTYILKRANVNTVKSTFIYKDTNSLLFKVQPESKVIFIVDILVSTILLIVAMAPVYAFYTRNEMILCTLYLGIVLVIYSYSILFFMNRTMKAKILSENNELRGFIISLSKYRQLKSVLLFRDWKFWSIDHATELSIHFRSFNEGILIFNKDTFRINVTRNKGDKQHFSGISKIRAQNEKDDSIISIEVPDRRITKRKPPKILEIKATESINDLIIFFFVTVITSKFFIIDR